MSLRGHRPLEQALGPPQPWPVLGCWPPRAPGLSSLPVVPHGPCPRCHPRGDPERELVLSAVYVFRVSARSPRSPSWGLAPRLWDMPQAVVGQEAPESGVQSRSGERMSRCDMVRGDRRAPARPLVLRGSLASWVLGSPVQAWGGSPRNVRTDLPLTAAGASGGSDLGGAPAGKGPLAWARLGQGGGHGGGLWPVVVP